MPSIDESAKAWQEQLAKRVGLAIRGQRVALGFTAQQLSEQTRDFGYPVSRAAISKIESNSRSGKVDLAELLVLAAALFTPPVALVFPGRYDDEIDVLPGLKTSQFDAAQWFSGIRNETFGTQSEELNSARDLVDKATIAGFTAQDLERIEAQARQANDALRQAIEERQQATSSMQQAVDTFNRAAEKFQEAIKIRNESLGQAGDA
ncbi:hypothetical protein NM962_06815 [Mycobacterium sp. SVM_VP21]|uniref:hypothetical protein n=1 Tax=Mycolicibacter icosiumassiliensis TaxID=1792835 RepID=UPI0008333AC0|nr:hypothetical protein [Mycolicibacter icosiumassiliensis]UVO13784.1 hypothetical protein NM962_06815 [Mycobacterium sp. SVM_VP21]